MVIVESWLGMNLSTSGMVIAWLMFTVCTFEVILLILFLMNVPAITRKLVHEDNPNRETVELHMRAFGYAVFGAYLTFTAIDILTCVFLNVAIFTRTRTFLVPWLLSNSLAIVFKMTILFFASVVWSISLEHSLVSLIIIIVNIFFVGIHIWMWIVIFSLYVHIHDKITYA